MQCERLIKLAKTWYLNVRDETMAPARMISFIEQHVANCNVCQKDPDLQDEIVKITQIILPESKIPKAFRSSPEDGDDLEDDLEVDDSENIEDDDSDVLEDDDLEDDDIEDDADLLDPDEL
jgi:hypothetical protein